MEIGFAATLLMPESSRDIKHTWMPIDAILTKNATPQVGAECRISTFIMCKSQKGKVSAAQLLIAAQLTMSLPVRAVFKTIRSRTPGWPARTRFIPLSTLKRCKHRRRLRTLFTKEAEYSGQLLPFQVAPWTIVLEQACAIQVDLIFMICILSLTRYPDRRCNNVCISRKTYKNAIF